MRSVTSAGLFGERQTGHFAASESAPAQTATINCPACATTLAIVEEERDALDAAVACEKCRVEPGASVRGLPAPVILTRCADCRANFTAGEATDAGLLVCRTCLGHALSEEAVAA